MMGNIGQGLAAKDKVGLAKRNPTFGYSEPKYLHSFK
jgi:hypothetical protein